MRGIVTPAGLVQFHAGKCHSGRAADDLYHNMDWRTVLWDYRTSSPKHPGIIVGLMYVLKFHISWLFAFAALIATADHAAAQQRTTATYEDWVVQCETRTGPPAEKTCDMAQVTQVQGKNVPFSRIVIRHPVKGQPLNLEIQLPVNAWLLTTVRVLASDGDPGLAAPFQRCIPNGCFAEFELKDDVMKKLRAAGSTGKIIFKDSTNHDVTVPLSFKGFGQAFDALLKE